MFISKTRTVQQSRLTKPPRGAPSALHTVRTDLHRGLRSSERANPKIHRVLGGESRQMILELLKREGRALHVSEIAPPMGLQPNTIRVHLELLCSVGLVRRVDEVRIEPGRPRVMYEFVPSSLNARDSERTTDAPDYQRLTQLLIAGMEASGNVADIAREAGARWAKAVSEERAPAITLSAPEAFDILTNILARLGFAPEPDLESEQIVLHECPFKDIAREHRAVVCAVHLGMIEATAEHLDSPLEVVGLNPFVNEEPMRCVVELVVKRPSSGGTGALEDT